MMMKLVWQLDAKDKFSIKSAHKLYLSELEQEEGLQGHSGGHNGNFKWKQIWKYQVLDKMKHSFGGWPIIVYHYDKI